VGLNPLPQPPPLFMGGGDAIWSDKLMSTRILRVSHKFI
jgi:hypothetical protein